MSAAISRRMKIRRSLSDHAIPALEQREEESPQVSQPKRWLLRGDHPLKIAWDVLTVILSLLNAYATHQAIRDRQFQGRFRTFCHCWFVMDMLLCFVTEQKMNGQTLKRPIAVWARYLTTWFVIDAISLIPGELIFVQPLIDRQNKRNIFTKYFFRSKAVVRVTRVLRGRHFRWFGSVAKQSRRAGMGGARRLLRLIIKYVPKYWMFLRNMKGIIVLRVLRQWHWIRRLWKSTSTKDLDDDTVATVDYYDDDGDPF